MPIKIDGETPKSALDSLMEDGPNPASKAIAAAAQETLHPTAVADDEPDLDISDAVDDEPSTAPNVMPEVDELADLLAWDAEQKKSVKGKRLKELKDYFQALAAEKTETGKATPDQVISFMGEKHEYVFGAQGTTRAIKPETGKARIIELLGAEQFITLAEIKLGDLDKYLTIEQRDEVLDYDRSSRTGKMLDKG